MTNATTDLTDVHAAAKLNLARALGLFVCGAIILAIDGRDMRWVLGGPNGAPVAYFAYLMVGAGALWAVFALRGYLAQRKTPGASQP